MADVFISYKAEEFNDANWIRTVLETNGLSCWMAPASIPGGSSYAAEIPKAIRAAKVFVLVLSEKCQLSRWVPRELDQAINEGKTILPFMLENCQLRDDFNFYLSNVQRYAAYEDKSAAVEKMIKEIRAVIGASAQTEEESDLAGEAVPVNGEAAGARDVPPAPAIRPAVEAVKKKKDGGKRSAGRPGNKAKPLFWILFAIVLTVLGTVLSAVMIVRSSTVPIAGKRYGKNSTSLTLKEKTLSAGDVANFSRFKKLSALYITDCSLPDDDLGAVFSCASYRLEISNSNVSDRQLSSVDFEKVSLTVLVLDGNRSISGLGALSPLGGDLQELSFNDCSVSDISFLSDFSALRKLNAAGNKISSLDPLSGCMKLEIVDVSGNDLGSLSGLERCISLRELYAQGNHIESLDAIKNTTLLYEVDLSGNNISDVSFLSKSKDHLYRVRLANNKIEEIDALRGAANLTELNVSGNKTASLAPLSGCAELSRLYAAGNDITDISALSGLSKLVEIDLSNNRIEKTDSISFDRNAYGVTLDLSHNLISVPVLPKVRYKYLAVYGNPISDWSDLNRTNGSTLVVDYSENAGFEGLSESDYYDYYIFDCPLDKQIATGNALGSYKVHFTSEKDYVKE